MNLGFSLYVFHVRHHQVLTSAQPIKLRFDFRAMLKEQNFFFLDMLFFQQLQKCQLVVMDKDNLIESYPIFFITSSFSSFVQSVLLNKTPLRLSGKYFML